MKWRPRSAVVVSGERLLERQRRPVLAAAPQDPVPPVDLERLGAAGSRVERVARVRAADVRADRTARAAGVVCVVGEVVRVGEARIVRVRRQRERGAAGPAADHLRGESKARVRVAAAVVAAGGLVGEAPEPADVLAQLAEDEVAAVVGARARRCLAVLVLVAVQELAGLTVCSGGPVLPSPSTNGCEIPSRKPNGSKPSRSAVPSRRTSERPPAGGGSAPPRAAPGSPRPARRGAARRRRATPGPPQSQPLGAFSSEVAEDPRPVRCRHPGDELVRELRQGLCGQPQPPEPGARERDVDRVLRAAVLRVRDRAARLAEPAPRGGRVLDRQQQERRRLQVAVAAGEEPLDVAELELHSDCTHSRSSGSPCRPARIRSFCATLSAVRSP